MKKSFYLDLARNKLRMPIGTHLVLAEQPDHDACLEDGAKLGHVIAETARRFKTPLAFPLMDLMVEKQQMLSMLDIPPGQADTFHFSPGPEPDALERIRAAKHNPVNPRLAVYADAIRHVAQEPDLVPLGMAIGPFSLMTKLLADPITGLYLAGTGLSRDEDEEVAAIEDCIALATEVIERSLKLQLEAGAKAICLCEPAANLVYLSPHQLAEGADTFERFVMQPNRRLRQVLADYDADLIFHDCGELTDDMVRAFCTLDPAILSLGSSRKLWEDAGIVPDHIVLFGNLPTKKFYSDAECPLPVVTEMARDLATRMSATNHPFILGSECDVLSVPGLEQAIMEKVMAFIDA